MTGHRAVVPDPPAVLLEAAAPVEVLHVEPVALVEQPDLLERLAPHEHERAVDRVHVAGLVLAELRRAVLRERAPRVAPAADAGEVRERARAAWETSAWPRGRSVPSRNSEPAADHPDVRVALEHGEQVVEHPGA